MVCVSNLTLNREAEASPTHDSHMKRATKDMAGADSRDGWETTEALEKPLRSP